MLPPLLCCFILLESQYFCHACCFVSFSCTGAVLAWGFCLFLVLLCSDVFSTSCKVVLSTFASLLTMHTGCFSHLRRLLCLVRGLFSTENVLICNATLEPEIAANARSLFQKNTGGGGSISNAVGLRTEPALLGKPACSMASWAPRGSPPKGTIPIGTVGLRSLCSPMLWFCHRMLVVPQPLLMSASWSPDENIHFTPQMDFLFFSPLWCFLLSSFSIINKGDDIISLAKAPANAQFSILAHWGTFSPYSGQSDSYWSQWQWEIETQIFYLEV